MQPLVVLFLALAGTSIAAPSQGKSGSQLVPVVSAASAYDQAAPVPLPGFNHLARNTTDEGGDAQPPAGATFDGTCEQITLGGYGKVGMTTLDGLCKNSAGQWWKTSLNLNECIGNVGGNLVYQPGGGFDATCRPCTIDNIHGGDNMNLKCNCLDDKRMPRFTALEIGSHVGNPLAVKLVSGRFVCGGNNGSMGPAFLTIA